MIVENIRSDPGTAPTGASPVPGMSTASAAMPCCRKPRAWIATESFHRPLPPILMTTGGWAAFGGVRAIEIPIADRHPGSAPFVGIKAPDHRQRLARIRRRDRKHRVGAALRTRLGFALELVPGPSLPGVCCHSRPRLPSDGNE